MKRLAVLVAVAWLVVFGCQQPVQKATPPDPSGSGDVQEPVQPQSKEPGEKAAQLQQELTKLKEQLKTCMDKSMTAFKEGVTRYETGNYTAALEKFEEFILSYPTSPLVPLARELRDRAYEDADRVKKLEKKWGFSISDLTVVMEKQKAEGSWCVKTTFKVVNNSDKPIKKLPIKVEVVRATDGVRFGTPAKQELEEEEVIEADQSRGFVIPVCGVISGEPVGLLVSIEIKNRDYKRVFTAP